MTKFCIYLTREQHDDRALPIISAPTDLQAFARLSSEQHHEKCFFCTGVRYQMAGVFDSTTDSRKHTYTHTHTYAYAYTYAYTRMYA